MGKRLSIIIPAHNESKRIGRMLESYLSFFKERLKDDFEIIVVANNCKDNTVEVSKKAVKNDELVTILDFKKGGKGFAIKQGFKYALDRNFELIGFVDADLATSPKVFYNLVGNIKNYDGILASRYIKNAVVEPKQTFIRILASRVFNFLVRSLFFINARDTQCGAKLFTRRAIEKILPKLEMSQWAIDIDILYHLKKSGLKVKEIPTVWREPGGSGLNLKKASMQMFLAIIQLRMLNSPMKRVWGIVAPVAGMLYKLVR